MINREQYLAKLRQLKDKRLIKVVSGVRRSGKSTLFEMFRDELIGSGVSRDQIVFINFEDPEYAEGANYFKIYKDIQEQLLPNKMNYVFLDEIQNVPEFEKLADGLFIKKNVDLYMTGSNAYFLSSELATLLTGRYIEIKILPLSFAEYVSAFEDRSRLDLLFQDYLVKGAFPQVAELMRDQSDLVNEYLMGLYHTVLFKDVIHRKGIGDRAALEHITRFIFDNVGNFTSPNKMAGYMTSNYRKIASRTVDTYLSALTDSFMVYPVNRYDIKGKRFLQTQQKYYLVDTGMRTALLGNRGGDLGHVLENVVYLELKRRGNDVWIGKTDRHEVDFVAKDNQGNIAYYQVAYTAREQATLDRELASLQNIADHNPKFLITNDVDPILDFGGIKKVNVIDWLLGR
ncbi:MAG: ATP-binding protein [Clostridiales Family XIII bacterium]|jgi:predicted AAA+ superfamily ATPase|nr:ATP-binding protein [Clostridiales Family XIII bacterium]